MILNVSGRTDICAFYLDWFINRLNEGYVYVRNPYYNKQVSKVILDDIDLIVFCTKNPIPLMKNLDKFEKYNLCVQVTITPYKKDIERNVLDKAKIIEAFKQISKRIGKEKMVLRYDPIFLSEKYNINYHKKAFEKLCVFLKDYLDHIIISFLDEYKNVKENKNALSYLKMNKEMIYTLASTIGSIAKKYDIPVQACAEEYDFSSFGIKKEACISEEYVKKITGYNIVKNTKRSNRKYCTCIPSIDVGEYNTCPNLCAYCYANYNEKEVLNRYKLHNKTSPVLTGNIVATDIIKLRKDVGYKKYNLNKKLE